ncbi:hypothetical protein [Nocardia alni]|nr:hypothetical protein [Nocardia alni]
MKRFLFLVIAVVVGASIYDYGRSGDHYGLVIAVGVFAVLLLAGKVLE